MDDRLMKEILVAQELYSICNEIKDIMAHHDVEIFNPYIDSCLEHLRILSTKKDINIAKETVSKLSDLAGGRQSLSDIQFTDKMKTLELYSLVRTLNEKINIMESIYGLSHEVGEYSIEKDKVKYKWFKKK